LNTLKKAETAAHDPAGVDAVWQALAQARAAIRDSGSRPVIELDGSNLADAISPLAPAYPSRAEAYQPRPDPQPKRAGLKSKIGL